MPHTATEVVRRHAHPLEGDADLDPLVERLADASVVLLGEATHGTHEFYDLRATITKRLVAERGFDAVAAEADWADALEASRVARGERGDVPALDGLAGFTRFPLWMWRNADVLDLLGWLQRFNRDRAPRDLVGFYGLDLYGLYDSVDHVIRYLSDVDPEAARRAEDRYSCFDHTAADPQAYGYAVDIGTRQDCEEEAIEQLLELRDRREGILARDGALAEDEQFYAEENARVVQNAEAYYRQMFSGRVSTWNLRDRHMADTLDALVTHRERLGGGKVIVWAHNSHVGDARATEMGARGELNIGQLARERHGDAAVNVGFTTHTGTVAAASHWGRPAEKKRVRPSLPDSYEAIFHRTELPRFHLLLEDETADALAGPRLERAIGVVYRPETERWSHYFSARLAEQFDAVVHVDASRAVEPLDKTGAWEAGVPETYPYGV